MTTTFKLRRGTAAENATFTGAVGEITVNTDNNSLHVHDGSYTGGRELALADFSNVGNAVGNAHFANGGTNPVDIGGDFASLHSDDRESNDVATDVWETRHSFSFTKKNANSRMFMVMLPSLEHSNTAGMDQRATVNGVTYTQESSNFANGSGDQGTNSPSPNIFVITGLAKGTYTVTIDVRGMTSNNTTMYYGGTVSGGQTSNYFVMEL